MFLTSPASTRISREALEVWRSAAHLVWVRWQGFLAADSASRRPAFAAYLAAVDAEEAAARDLALHAERDRKLIHVRIQGTSHAR
jgi:hypothetical protein